MSVNIAMTGAVETGLIGDEADALVFEFAEAFGFENVQACLGIGVAGDTR